MFLSLYLNHDRDNVFIVSAGFLLFQHGCFDAGVRANVPNTVRN